MLRRLARLVGGTAGVLAALVVSTFLLVQLAPGDPARRIGGMEATAEQLAQLRSEFGLDKPLLQRFGAYVSGLARGDLGRSYATREPVMKVIGDRLAKTLWLAATSVLLMVAVAVPLGLAVAAATTGNRNRALDVGFTTTTSILGALPGLLVATVLAYVFAVWLRLLPVAGAERWYSVILPAVAIALRPLTELARIVRVETLNVLAMDYMRTARAKRMASTRLYLRHALPNVLTAALTLGGLIFAHLVGGAVVIENVFAWPGMGTALVNAVIARDFPVVQGVVLLLGLVVVLVNALVDLALALLDPRTAAR